MKLRSFSSGLLCFALLSCNSSKNTNQKSPIDSEVKIVSAMKDVMWKGDLTNKIYLDTISNKKKLYGIGPLSYLSGEVLINDGKSYIARVETDSSMKVEKTFQGSAPFFVYANVDKWEAQTLNPSIKSITDIENYINTQRKNSKNPFAFKLIGNVVKATIHLQNLPPGTKVSSPSDAHQDQTNYTIKNQEVEIIGFFSRVHQGIFTHHDSFIHMHLITKREDLMGHLDDLEIDTMNLYLSKE